MKEIYLAGGCFWGVEKYFSLLSGVKETAVGYANGKTKNPTYEQVCHEDTGHAETVKVIYNSKEITLNEVLLAYYKIIDPVSFHKQGADTGIQYRTGIYYTDLEDAVIISASLKKLQLQYQQPLLVEHQPLLSFYKAEEYHQNYLGKNPGGYCHIPISFFTSKKK